MQQSAQDEHSTKLACFTALKSTHIDPQSTGSNQGCRDKLIFLPCAAAYLVACPSSWKKEEL